jgi:hypothetical protein
MISSSKVPAESTPSRKIGVRALFPFAHPVEHALRHGVAVAAGKGPELAVVALLHLADEAAAPRGDARHHGRSGIEELAHPRNEAFGEAFHLADLVDEIDLVPAPRYEGLLARFVDRRDIDPVLRDPMRLREVDMRDDGARAVERRQAKSPAFACLANFLGIEAARSAIEEAREVSDRGALARARDARNEQVPLQSTVMPRFLMSGTQNA